MRHAVLDRPQYLAFTEEHIRRSGPGNAIGVCARQWITERRLARSGVRFRTTNMADVEAAYSRMTEAEFEAVNGRQDWANWRTIPRSLSGVVEDRPLRIVDLGCGSGGSTRVLAHYAPLGSQITGYDLAAPLVRVAKQRSYAHADGTPADVEFCIQPITKPLRDEHGDLLSPGSVDIVNASGIVGHHLDARAICDLACELQDLLSPEGIAMLDVGRKNSAARLTRIMADAGFEPVRYRRSSVFDRTGQVVFRVQA